MSESKLNKTTQTDEEAFSLYRYYAALADKKATRIVDAMLEAHHVLHNIDHPNYPSNLPQPGCNSIQALVKKAREKAKKLHNKYEDKLDYEVAKWEPK